MQTGSFQRTDTHSNEERSSDGNDVHDTHTAVPQLQLHILFHIALLLAYKVAYCITFRARKRISIHELHLCTSSLPLHHVHPPLQLPEADLSPHGTLHTLGVQLQCDLQDSVHHFAVSGCSMDAVQIAGENPLNPPQHRTLHQHLQSIVHSPHCLWHSYSISL